MASFPPATWFEQLFGFKESPQSVQAHLTCSLEGENVLLTSDVNHATYNAGNFQIRDVPSFNNLTVRGGGKLNIVVGNGRRTTNLSKVDALSMQSLPENDGASYQAASNFNCLEFVNPQQTALDGVTNYVYDLTQGPYVALACPQSIIVRNYFYEHPDGKIGQLEKEIELLEKTPIHVEHGYAIIDDQDVKKLSESNFDWSNLSNYKVGVHKNCQVLMTRQGQAFTRTQDNIVSTHIYAAAFNFYGLVRKNDFTLGVSRHLLTAEYKAAILSAWENSFEMEKQGRKGAKKLYLTLIGGGVFDNPKEMIAEVIASCEKEIIDSGLEVYVVAFDQNAYQSIKSQLEPIVQKTGGQIVEVQ
ncbi:hypothetical protein TRFO_17450 [Tritrichomonas foetus]|uniref:Macro domain-containing protein n=1 Tax=Tritrichomonas foetus TaxID=1144522 RepID=A0A1J4KND6_9EUKA|nr:hypothetical protein TRFO_17450 [Tritrichomonas foetus]|eukprot:OHT12634.1 hypothetical protein TRFO_17450 [Tritrichomonas foetus]